MRSLAPPTSDLTVDVFVPVELPAVCRILHPFQGEADEDMRWQQAADELGLDSLDELWQQNARTAARDEDRIQASGIGEPLAGELSASLAGALVEHLAEATGTPDDVYVAIWSGWGDVPPQRFPGAANLDTAHRGHFLLRGPLRGVLTTVAATPFNRPASGIWWPADRAWFVHSEIDFPWTFVAGSEALIRSLLDSHLVEALPAEHSEPALRLPA